MTPVTRGNLSALRQCCNMAVAEVLIEEAMRGPVISTAWCMPNKYTFQQPPIAQFVRRWTAHAAIIIDPFCGASNIATLRNDLALGGIDAGEWCEQLLPEYCGRADVVIFDPPYSPRQIAECYKSVGRSVSTKDTQNAALYSRVRKPLGRLLRIGGIALSFGWQSSGFGKAWPTIEILLIQHGGAHNDTICVAQKKPADESSHGDLFGDHAP